MEIKMTTANLVEFKTRREELERQAKNYRLVKSIQKNDSPVSRFVSSLGSVFTQLISQ